MNHLHGYPFVGISGKAALQGILQGRVFDLGKVDAVAGICDSMHLEKELQSWEGGMPMYHLVQYAA